MVPSLRKLLLSLLFVASAVFAKAQTCPCVQVELSSKTKVMSLKEYRGFTVSLKFTNCSGNNIEIDTVPIIDYESGFWNSIFFRFEKCSDKGCMPYEQEFKADVGIMEKPNADKVLKPGASVVVYVRLHPVYNIFTPGQYRIRAYYRIGLRDNPGRYIVETEYIDITVK